jgi:fatty-acyl-CoA synthase
MLEGLMQDYQLTLPAIIKRAETLYGYREIVTRQPDMSFHHYTYADFSSRAKKLSVALEKLGVESGDRVGTLAPNTYQHLEAYFGIPCSGAVLHTINPRLHEGDLAYIANHAGDKVLMVDGTLVEVLESFREQIDVEHVVIFDRDNGDLPDGAISYEGLLADADEGGFDYPEFDEKQGAAMCYTSGTTGRPKGALYSHRAIALHSMMLAMGSVFGFSEADCILPVVPMYHVNAWGLPFVATLVGAKQVMPGSHLDAESLLEAFEQERVTFTSGVPTVYLAVLEALDEEPEKYDLSSIRMLVIGGSAAPRDLLKGYKERHDINARQGWGMTEMSPVGAVANLTTELEKLPQEKLLDYKAKQGPPVPFIEVRARHEEENFVPWDGETMGELEVRGPWVAKGYFNTEEGTEKFTEDGWFKTGDIVTIDEHGFVEVQDRDKDLVKSGGEWISSVALENALMAHPAVAEAAVIAIDDEKWDERPLAVVVLKEGQEATPEELHEHLEGDFAKFWLPDAYEFIDEIPKTATGKFLKLELRKQFQDYTVSQG